MLLSRAAVRSPNSRWRPMNILPVCPELVTALQFLWVERFLHRIGSGRINDPRRSYSHLVSPCRIGVQFRIYCWDKLVKGQGLGKLISVPVLRVQYDGHSAISGW